MSSSTSENTEFKDETKIGDCAAQQPLSGIRTVHQTGAVNGHGGFVMMPIKSDSVQNTSAA